MSNMRVPKSRIVEAACRNDFISFFRWCFRTLERSSALSMNWHHYAMAFQLELVLHGLVKRLIIVAPPRTHKSLMSSVALPAFMLGRNPSERIIGISYSSELATKFSNDFRMIVESPEYQSLFPQMRISKNTESEIRTTQGGYRLAKSSEGSLTGLGGGILILDDIQKPLDTHSDARRSSTNSNYYSTIASRLDNQNSGAIIVVGQRLHIDDLIGTLLRSTEEWAVLSLPAIAVKEELIPIGGGPPHLRKVGDLLHPERQSPKTLDALRLDEPEIFAAQYQQDPIPPGGFMIKREHIQYCDQLPRRTSSSIYLQSWDTAQKPGENNSRSACLDIFIQDNRYFVASALVGQWQYHELEQRVLLRANEQKPDVILIEDAGFGTALIGTLKQMKLPVVAIKPEGDKRTRLLRHISNFTNRQVFVLKNAPGRAELETEWFSFPGGQRDDLVDALTQAFGYKHSRYLWTDEAIENYTKLIFSLRRFP